VVCVRGYGCGCRLRRRGNVRADFSDLFVLFYLIGLMSC